MGLYHHLYVEPYVSCTLVRHKELVKVRRCPKPECTKPKPIASWASIRDTFCPGCGTAIAEVEISVMKGISPYDVIREETLFVLESGSPASDDKLHFGANQQCGPRDFSVAQEEFHLDIKTIDVAKEIDLFTKQFAKEIDACRAAYQDVVVSWGVHQYYR